MRAHSIGLSLLLAAVLPAQDARDPTKGEVRLPSTSGWNAALLLDNGDTGVWTVKAFSLFEPHAVPEIVGLDDDGQCHILVSYSGKWTPTHVVHDREWLGGLAHGDVDPAMPGAELYTGGKRGNLFQVRTYKHGAVDCRLIAHLPGMEIHTIVAGDLDPRSAGPELLVFTRPGAVYRVTPTGEHGEFETTCLEGLRGRVRDALVLPAGDGETPWLATVSRAGCLRLLRIGTEGPVWRTVYESSMGMGRIARRPVGHASEKLVLYSTHDDGRVLRHEGRPDGAFTTETVYLGPQGLRGVVAGRFDARPGVETIAVFGYSKKVQLLSREPDKPWTVETIFTDRDKGHWLCAAELDGRNATDEIVGSGYGGRIFMLSRPPGYGRAGIPVDGAAVDGAAVDSGVVDGGAVEIVQERPRTTATSPAR